MEETLSPTAEKAVFFCFFSFDSKDKKKKNTHLVVYANRQHQVEVAVAVHGADNAGADRGVHAQGAAVLVHVFDDVVDVAAVEGDLDVLALQMSFQVFLHVAHFAVGGDGHAALGALHADQVVLAFLGHQAGAVDGVLQFLALDGDTAEPCGGEDLPVVDVLAGQQAGDQSGVAHYGHQVSVVHMEGDDLALAVHDVHQLVHDPAGDDGLDLALVIRQDKIVVVALHGQAEAVQADQMQLGGGDFHQAAGQGLAALLDGDGKGHLGDHIPQLFLGEVQGEGMGEILHLGELVGADASQGGAALTAADGNRHLLVHGEIDGAFGQLADDFRQQAAGQNDLTRLDDIGLDKGLDAQAAVGAGQIKAVFIGHDHNAFQNLHGRAGAEGAGSILQAIIEILRRAFKLHVKTSHIGSDSSI